MDKEMMELAYLKELDILHFYQQKYTHCDKTVREYEHCRQRYLQHHRTAQLYKTIIRQAANDATSVTTG